jgi:hypothetical protein
LRRLQEQLRRETFRFQPQIGVPKKRSGKSSRPIVIAPVENRIIQRAILDCLKEHCTGVKEILNIPTSVGGIEGVDKAIALVNNAMTAGAKWCVRSDIPGFFTKIPKAQISDFIADHTSDAKFAELFRQAIEVELGNEESLGPEAELFPTADIGVAQGSSLSPLVGNILLRGFDRQMNGRDVTCIRYIDDFVLLAPSKKAAKKAFSSAKAALAELGLEAYDPITRPDKAYMGECSAGFDFLGCRIVPGLVRPADSARNSLLEKVRRILSDGRRSITSGVAGSARVPQGCAQTLVAVDRVVKGWGDAFSFCSCWQSLEHLDQEIDREIQAFMTHAIKRVHGQSPVVRRRLLAVHPFIDTKMRLPAADHCRSSAT